MKSGKFLTFTFALFLLPGMSSTVSVGQNVASEIPDEIINSLFEDLCSKGCSHEEVTRWKNNLKLEKHDLNGDAIPELFLWIDHSDWCGAGANCDYWIFQKTGYSYTLLLNDKVLRMKDTVTNGYRDLASETPMGFCGRNIQRLSVTPYRYDGKKYKPQSHKTECKEFTPPAEP